MIKLIRRNKKITLLLLSCSPILFSCSFILFLLYLKITHIPTNQELTQQFQENKTEFIILRDMIVDDEKLLNVSKDNVGDFRSYHGKWTTDKPPYKSYSDEEMLKSVGLSKERYSEYLDLL